MEHLTSATWFALTAASGTCLPGPPGLGVVPLWVSSPPHFGMPCWGSRQISSHPGPSTPGSSQPYTPSHAPHSWDGALLGPEVLTPVWQVQAEGWTWTLGLPGERGDQGVQRGTLHVASGAGGRRMP